MKWIGSKNCTRCANKLANTEHCTATCYMPHLFSLACSCFVNLKGLPDILADDNFLEYLWPLEDHRVSLTLQKQIFCLWSSIKMAALDIVFEENFTKFGYLNFYAKTCTAVRTAYISLRANSIEHLFVTSFSDWFLEPQQRTDYELDFYDHLQYLRRSLAPL